MRTPYSGTPCHAVGVMSPNKVEGTLGESPFGEMIEHVTEIRNRDSRLHEKPVVDFSLDLVQLRITGRLRAIFTFASKQMDTRIPACTE